MKRGRSMFGFMILMTLFLCTFATLRLYAGEWGPYESEGTVIAVLPQESSILLDHEPIRGPGYLMGKMEMPFSVEDPSLLTGLKAGDRIHFRVSEEKKSRIIELKKLP